MQISLFAPLIGIQGWGAPDQRRAYSRMIELRSKIGEDLEDRQLFRPLVAMAIHHFVEGEFSKSATLGEQLFSIYCQTQDPTDGVIAHMILGFSSIYMGELLSARDHLEQAWALYDPDRLRHLMAITGIEVGVSLRGWQALVWWTLGYPERAGQFAQAMLAQAQALKHPTSLDYTLVVFIPALLIMDYDRKSEFEWPEAQAQPVSEKDLIFFNHFTEVMRGYIQVERGETEQGIAHMYRNISNMQMSGIQIGRPFLLYLLAIANLKANQPDQGLAIVKDVLSLLEKSDNHFFLAGFYQLMGELLVSKHQAATRVQHSTGELSLSYIQEAENCFLTAIEVAQRQKAKSWELKAAVSLARLWQEQGKREEARTMLEAIYGWFTEGFDQPDLRKAKALLKALE